MVAISFFEGWFTYPFVYFFTIVREICRYRSFVQNVGCCAYLGHGAFVGVTAVAITGGQWFRFLQDFLVVYVDTSLYAWHASVTNFDRLAVEDLVQGVVRRKMSIEESEKFLPNVRFNGIAEGGLNHMIFLVRFLFLLGG